MRDSHRKNKKEEVKGVMMPMPELKNYMIDRSQTREKLLPEHRILDTDRLSLEDEAGVGDVVIKRIAVMIAELYASGYNGTESEKYHWLLVYNSKNFANDTDGRPLLDWIVATTPQTASGESNGTIGLQGGFDHHRATPCPGPSDD